MKIENNNFNPAVEDAKLYLERLEQEGIGSVDPSDIEDVIQRLGNHPLLSELQKYL